MNFTILPNPAYLPELLKQIDAAKSSVVGINYLAELSRKSAWRDKDRALDLAKAFIAAKRRGAQVMVILEGSKFNNNYPFYRMLKDAGVDVWMDTSLTFVHQKAVLIDDNILIAGSHNWTDASLARNEELSVLVEGKKAAAVFKRELEKITRQRDEIKGLSSKETIRLPDSLQSSVIAPLYRKRADLAFNLYMLICLEDSGHPRPLPIDCARWGRELGFDPAKAGKGVDENYRKYYYGQRVNAVLNQLRHEGLIEVDRQKDTATRAPIPCSKFRIEIPKSFWRFGWLTLLSFAAKYFYVISIMETKDSPFYPWWSLSTRKIGGKYKCDHASAGAGARELEDFGILEVLRDVPVLRGEIYSEESHYYRLNPFYDMSDFDQKFAALRQKFGASAADIAQKVAGSFGKTHDLDAIGEIAGLVDRAGSKKVISAGRKIASLPLESSRRQLSYLVQICG